MSSFFDKWLKGVGDGWGIPALLFVFVGLWTAFLVIAYLNADLHPDVIEAWASGQTFQWSGIKHPPLMGWVAGAWSLIFPARDWSLQLLAMTNSAIALWAVDLIARRFGTPQQRILILLLLMLTPIYQFQAQRFNANSVMFAAWPLAIYCFMHSFETRKTGWAIAAGFTGALALLGKYYSIFLLIGFLFAALAHPDRQRYFRSKAPWISICAGALFLSPHLYFLFASGFAPFGYAFAIHGGFTFGQSLRSGLSFLLGIAATLATPALVLILINRHSILGYLQSFKLMDPRLSLLFLIGIGTIISPPLVSLLSNTAMSPVWASQGLFIFVVVAVCAAQIPIEKAEVKKLTGIVLALTVIALIIAPIHAFYRNSHPYSEGRNYYSLATRELMLRWRAITPLPLKIVSGNLLASAISFYSPDHPEYVSPARYFQARQMPSDGWATMCFQDDPVCRDWAKQVLSIAPTSVSFDFVIQPSFFQWQAVPTQVYAVIVPPS